MKKAIYLGLVFLLLVTSGFYYSRLSHDNEIVSYVLDLEKQELAFYLKDDTGKNYGSFKNLKTQVSQQDKELVFAMNGGMYMEDGFPLGLYIENGEQVRKLNTRETAYGNFYMQPNGVFSLTNDNKAIVSTTKEFNQTEDINYATQSGPMLVIDGALHPKFKKGSINVQVRNGVGVLPDGKILFAMAKKRINFYDFAMFFKKNGCKNALYLDGFVSRTYLPSEGLEELRGDFGVIMAEVK